MGTTLAFLSLIGAAVFAASGALVANEERFDLVGALFLSVVAGLGGGTIVDLVVGAQMVRWVKEPAPLWIAVAAGICVFLLARFVRLPGRALLWADGVGLAVFTATGMDHLMQLEIDPAVAIFLTAVGASGGGILRDVMANRTPIVFSGELYVTAALAGGAAFLLARLAGSGAQAPLAAALIVTGLVRGGAIMFGWRMMHGRGGPNSVG
jgi:uncharacterized membrane protein YeiH